jgi:hypothetical protein
MEIPIVKNPEILDELLINYRSAFPEIRQFRHFSELISALNNSEKRSVAHLNSIISDHVNQSNMNRFLVSKFDKEAIFRKTIDLINSVEKDGVLAIDDTIVEKTGKHIEGANWIFDHSVGKNVFGMQLATCTFSGKYGFYPIFADIYRRLESLEREKKEDEYLTKIDMQVQTIGKCISAGLNFHTVVGDIWYFTKDMTKFLSSKNLNWVFQSKGNRKIKIKGRWTTLDLVPLSYIDSVTMKISGNIYSTWEMYGKMTGIGSVNVIISEGINGKRYYVTNRMKWTAKRILETYLQRWDIEVMHRDFKQDGLGHIFLRKLCKTDLYLRLIVTGRVLLEISSIRSLCKYPGLNNSVEKRKRWISFELLKSMAKTMRRFGNRFMDALEASITYPYRSTRSVFFEMYNRSTI